jgi:cellulose synthase/poly-beta-1,6-N-acetylglucosamine synthase-like glycosyltransferase
LFHPAPRHIVNRFKNFSSSFTLLDVTVFCKVDFAWSPSSWKNFKQKTIWNRGSFQAVIKHRKAFGNQRFGYLRNLTFKYIILSMIIVTLVSVVLHIFIFLAVSTGYAFQVLVVFMLIQATYSFLGILMDNEDFKLIIFSALFVVCYKQLRDLIKINRLSNILLRREIKWGTLKRMETPETKSKVKPTRSIGR